MRTTMAYDAGNRRDVRALEKQAKLADQQRREIVTGIMSVEPGRRWMHDILTACHIVSTSFSDVGLRMAFMEGQREVGIRLLTDIMGACPDQYIQMMREANGRASSNDARSQRNRSNVDRSDSVADADDDTGGDDSTDLYDDRAFGPDRAKEPN